MYYNSSLYFCTYYSFKTQRTRGKIRARFCIRRWVPGVHTSFLLLLPGCCCCCWYCSSIVVIVIISTIIVPSVQFALAWRKTLSTALYWFSRPCVTAAAAAVHAVITDYHVPPFHSAHPHQAVHFHQCTAFSLQSLYATDTWRTQAPTASIAMSPCAPGTSHAVCQATRHFQNSEELTTLLRNEQRSEHRKDAEERHGQRIDAENIALL